MSCRTQLFTELDAFSRLMTGILKRQLYSRVYYHVSSNIAVHVSLKVKGRDDISSNSMLYGNYHADTTDMIAQARILGYKNKQTKKHLREHRLNMANKEHAFCYNTI